MSDTRFWSKVDASGDCWEWTASLTHDGYGRFRLGTKTPVAHRVAWEMLVGPVPDGLTLDHLCRNRACVNPDHLEPVEPNINWQRGQTPSRRMARRTHCDRGHALSGENLRMRTDGGRRCLVCWRDYLQSRYE